MKGTERGALSRYCYIEAVRQQDMGNYGEAFELYRRSIELNPDAAEAYYSLSMFYLVLQHDSLGTECLKRAVQLAPDNTEFAERLARTYLMQNNMAEGINVYEQLAKQKPNRTDYLEMLARIYEQQHEYDKMLSALSRIEVQDGQSEDLTLTKMQAYSFMGDQEGAYRELKSLVDAHPNDMNLQVMLGNWLLSNGRKDEALQTFLAALKEEPDNAQGQMSLMDYYRSEGETEKADVLLYDMLVNPRTEPSARVTMLREYVKDSEGKGGDSLRVMQLFDRVLQLPQKTSEVAETKVAYMIMKNAPKDSIRAGWEKVLEITPEYVGARMQLIQLMWEDSIDEDVVKQCKIATEYVPDEPVLYYYLGMAQYINKHHQDALNSLRRGANNITKATADNVAADIYELLGDVLQKEHRMQEAFVAYDSCLVYDPDKVVCLNNYAYFLSLENKELKKAEKMSHRAITAEPNNATYLDTYAWILYQQKRYEEACIYIEQALKAEGDSVDIPGDILEHAGDIYYRLNRKDEALQMWQRALDAGVDDEALTRKKIKRKKL
ncbi:MAG: tetratricopeptide repeat protein [Prevotella sp.]|nr:tetratricopeptide repeat protein [Candidatus Prevotella equi]